MREKKIDHTELGMKAYSNLFDELVTSNVSCTQSKIAQRLLKLKGKHLKKRFKGRLAATVPHPIL